MRSGRGRWWSVAALVVLTISLVGGVAAAKPSPTTTTHPTFNTRHYAPGECVTWNERALAPQNARRVDCARPHIMEMTGVSVHVPGREYPTDEAWVTILQRLCVPAVETYLHHPLDPYGRFHVTAMRPLRPSWVQGDHSADCSLGARTVSATSPNRLIGRVDPNDQSLVYATGSCLGRSAEGLSLASCDGPHAVEVTGVADLTGRLDHPPASQEIADLLSAECLADAENYLGRPLDDGLEASNLLIDPASWNAGSHKTNCLVGKLENGQRVDLPGPLR